MKKPGKMNNGKPAMERKQGTPPGASGINKPVVKEKVPQVVMKNRFGNPTQRQKM